MTAYQDANNILQKYVLSTPISEQTFKELQAAFRQNYLASRQYHESIATHRNPDAVKNELLRELNDYLIAIQNRKEMRDNNPDTHSSAPISTTLAEMWRKDKSLRSLYRTTQAFCFQRQINFTTVAIHIAEYRTLYRLYNRIRKQIDRSSYRSGTPVS